MKRTEAMWLAPFATALLALAGAGAALAQDPAVVNAKTIHVKFENERVRVLEALLKPGDKENVHFHPEYVIYVITGGKVRFLYTDGTAAEAILIPGQTLFRGPLTHWAENVGDTEIKLVLVELKEPAKGSEVR
jgi:quercetin dioxygenase-like cupin family protein